MEVRLYLRMLLRGWWIIALTALAALIVALVVDYQTTAIYRTTAHYLVSPNASITDNNAVVNSLDTLDRRSLVATYAEILGSDRIYDAATRALGLDASQLVRYTHSAVVLPTASVIEISVSGPNPRLVTALADSIGQQAIAYARQLNPVYGLSVLNPAAEPAEPDTPQPLRDAALALGLGIVAGAGLAILREQMLVPLNMLRERNLRDNQSTAFTRRHFMQQLEQELARSRISPLSIGFVRLHGLEDLVEVIPQPIFQQILQEVVLLLRNELRGSDLVARWNDITLTLLLPATPSEAAARTLDRIRLALTVPLRIDRLEFDLDPIIGIGARQGDDTPTALVQRAEAALEKNRVKSTQAMPFSADALNELGFWEKGADALVDDKDEPK